jgi:hypothetical protein
MAHVKKTKIGAKTKACQNITFVFLHRPQKISIVDETLRTPIYYGDVHAEFFINFSRQFEICFLGRVSICT